MGVYVPYVNMPKTETECPMNFGGICCVFVEGEHEKGSFPSCIGVDCGRVIPIPRQGRWLTIREYFELFNKKPIDFDTRVICSVCGAENNRKTNYCPSCGIPMEH